MRTKCKVALERLGIFYWMMTDEERRTIIDIYERVKKDNVGDDELDMLLEEDDSLDEEEDEDEDDEDEEDEGWL